MKKSDREKRPARVGVVVLILALLISAVGCGTGGGETTAKHLGNKVKAPSGVKYFTQNKLTTETIAINSDGSPRDPDLPSPYDYDQMIPSEKAKWNKKDIFFSGSYIQISGLKNKELEESINDRLRQLCMDNLERIPAYRGAKAEAGGEPELSADSYTTVGENVCLNDNNILSVMLYSSKAFDTKMAMWQGYYSQDVNYIETLNIDLNTGEDIPIADVFCDDTDAIGYLNQKVAEAIKDGNGDEEGWFYGESLKITQPFQGISEDQKYYLAQSGILLVFDYDTPGFDVDFSYNTLLIPYSDEVAVTERFYREGENLYVSDASPSKRFPYDSSEAVYLDTDDYHQLNFSDSHWCSIERRATTTKAVPEFIQKEMEKFIRVDDSVMREKLLKGVPQDSLERQNNNESSLSGSIYLGAYSNRIGPFVTVSYTEDFNIWEEFYANEAQSQNVFADGTSRTETYDLRNGSEKAKILTFDDIFAKDVDAEKVIKQAMIDSINQEVRLRNSNQSEDSELGRELLDYDKAAASSNPIDQKDHQYIDELYDRISGVAVQCDALSLTIDGADTLYKEMYGEAAYEERDSWIYINCPASIYYSLVDCEQLTIFDY